MGRSFAGDGGTDSIDLGTVTNGDYISTDAWTAFIWANVPQQTADQQCMFSRDFNLNAHFQFLCRVNNDTMPSDLSVFCGNGSAATLRITITGAKDADTWQFIAVTNDGSETSGGLKAYVIDLDGTVASNTGIHNTNASTPSAGKNWIGRNFDSDECAGDLAYNGYIAEELTQAELVALSKDPWSCLKYSTLEWFLPLFGTGSPEPDYSGNGNHGTLTGTSVADNPPVGFPNQGLYVPYEAAVGGVTTRRYSLPLAGVG